MIKAAFLDRDGVINVDYGYVHKKEDFVFIEGVFEALKLLNSSNYKIIIITNQAGIAKGIFSEQDYLSLTNWYLNCLKKKNIEILDVFFCPFHIDGILEEYRLNSSDRKPKSGMFLKAIEKYGIDITKSFTVGDKITDIRASLGAGIISNYLIKEDENLSDKTINLSVAANLNEAVKDFLAKN